MVFKSTNLFVIKLIFLIHLIYLHCHTPLALSETNENQKSNSAPANTNNNKAIGAAAPPPPPPQSNYYSYLRCWRCDYDDREQCVKSFDFTKHKHEACDGKCLKAFEKIEARTKVEIDKAQLTPTIRKCVSQKEISSLRSMGINVNNGCHDIRTAKRRHKLYCFCENDLCNSAFAIKSKSFLFASIKSTFYATCLFLILLFQF